MLMVIKEFEVDVFELGFCCMRSSIRSCGIRVLDDETDTNVMPNCGRGRPSLIHQFFITDLLFDSFQFDAK